MRTCKELLDQLSTRNRELLSEYGVRLKSLYPLERQLVIDALEIFAQSYWPSLRTCVFRGLRRKQQVLTFVRFLLALQISVGQIRVIVFCKQGSPLVSAWRKHLPPGVLVTFRHPPNRRSKAVKRWIGIDVVFPAGKNQKLKAGNGFLLLLQLAGRLLEYQRRKRRTRLDRNNVCAQESAL